MSSSPSTSTKYDVAPWTLLHCRSGGSWGWLSDSPLPGASGIGVEIGSTTKPALDHAERVLPETDRTRQKTSPEAMALVGTTRVFTVVAEKSTVSNELEVSNCTS